MEEEKHLENQEQEFDVFDDLVESDNEQNSLDETDPTQLRLHKDSFLNPEDKDKYLQHLRQSTYIKPHMTKKQLSKNCTLETITKPGINHEEFQSDINEKIEKMQKTYPFKLDDFQKAAILSIEKN